MNLLRVGRDTPHDVSRDTATNVRNKHSTLLIRFYQAKNSKRLKNVVYSQNKFIYAHILHFHFIIAFYLANAPKRVHVCYQVCKLRIADLGLVICWHPAPPATYGFLGFTTSAAQP
jgi:hypothetical protein